MPKRFASSIAVAALVFASIHFGCDRGLADDSPQAPPATSPSTSQPSDDPNIIKVDADELFKAYKSSGVLADSVYGDRVLEVSGIVRQIALDFDKRPLIEFGGSDAIPAVAA